MYRCRVFFTLFVLLVIGTIFTDSILAANLVGVWTPQEEIFLRLASHTSLVKNNILYLIGGSASTGFFGDQVYSSQINSLGMLTPWINQGNLPDRRIWHASVLKNDYAYVLGGYFDPISAQDSVFKGLLSQSGSIQWTEINPLPKPLAQGAAVVVGNRIYFAGGFDNDVVYKADIHQNGSLGQWTVAGTLPSQMWGFVMVHSANKLLIFGGETPTGDISNVRSSSLQNDGTLSNWSELTPLPKSIRRGGGLLLGNVMIMAGGINNGSYLSTVYTSTIDAIGNTTTWDQSLNNLPFSNCCFSLTSWKNHLYMSGGHDGNAYYSTVYSSIVDVEVPETPTPTPTPIVTPSPTPIPISTTKVIILPGFGGSWNTNALLQCKSENYSGDWDLAAYAEPVYAPTVKALQTQRLTVNFFGYDWRRPVQESSQGLRSYIDNLTLPQEKVYLIGHSLGALVGEAFLENSDNATKVEKFLAVGGPMYGMPWAYGVWEGGEIWNDNLLLQIGANLAIKKCTGLPTDRIAIQQFLPVTQNMLPVFDYLRHAYTHEVVSLSDMQIHNNWLPRPLETLPLVTTVGTLTGEGKQTLSELFVSDATKKEIARGDWIDGKVFRKIRSIDGDGTVLLKSAQIPGADNKVISQSHLGLVMSAIGAESISQFLVGNSSPVTSTAFTEPVSATLILLDNAQATMTQPDLSVLHDANGVIAALNPKRGKHVVKIKPLQGDSKVTIGQFLPNGNVIWQEQSFIGRGERSATYTYGESEVNIEFK